jgi:chorismate synthase
VTTGAPLCAVIENTDTHSSDYSRSLRFKPRPSHSDYAAWVKYDGNNDPRGGGHFSGRLTAPLVFAGAVAEQILRNKDVSVQACISVLGGVNDPTPEQVNEIIMAAKSALDSVGGAVRCTVMVFLQASAARTSARTSKANWQERYLLFRR